MDVLALPIDSLWWPPSSAEMADVLLTTHRLLVLQGHSCSVTSHAIPHPVSATYNHDVITSRFTNSSVPWN